MLSRFRIFIISIFVLCQLVCKGQVYYSSDNGDLRKQLIDYYMRKNETEKQKVRDSRGCCCFRTVVLWLWPKWR